MIESYKRYFSEFESYVEDHLTSVNHSIGAVDLQLNQVKILPDIQLKLSDEIANDYLQSYKYSLLNGGKRFRPMLCWVSSNWLGLAPERSFFWGLAIEMIHTYSLIHDDLPCMDNDDFRRGKPTSHKVFGDAVALLAGDSLLTDSFGVISNCKESEHTKVKLVSELVNASGSCGMILGQFIDIHENYLKNKKTSLEMIHFLKTGALIGAAIVGPAIISEIPTEAIRHIQSIGRSVGFLFQIKDDILDFEQDKEGCQGNQVFVFANEDFEYELRRSSEIVITKIQQLTDVYKYSKQGAHDLIQLINWNLERTQ